MKTKIALIIVIVGLSIFSYLQFYNHKQNEEILESQVTELKLSNQRSDSIKNKLQQKVYTQEAIITKDQASLKELVNDKFNLTKKYENQIKQTIAYYSSKTVTKVVNVPVPFVDQEERKRFSDSLETVCAEVIKYYEDSTIKVPKEVNREDKDLKFHGTVFKDGFNIDSLSVPDSTYLRFDIIKGGFLKKDFNGKRRLFLKKSVQVKVLHTSPYVKVLGQNSVIYQPKVKSNIIPVAIGFVVGLLIGSQ